MKKLLRCIGGRCAGLTATVPEGHDSVVMLAPVRQELMSRNSIGIAPRRQASGEQILYTVRSIMRDLRRVEFLAPNEMSDIEALRTVLEP